MSEPTSLRDPEDVFTWEVALDHPEMLAAPVVRALTDLGATSEEAAALARTARVAGIDPALSDTEALAREFSLDPAATANCVLVGGKRSGQALGRLQAMGYQKASNEGGLDTLGKKYPVVK